MSAEDNEINEDTVSAADDPNEESVSINKDNEGTEDTTKENDSLMKKKDEEIALLKDQILRSRADFDNFRKRCIKTEDLNKKLAVKDFALDIIKVHDDLIRASEAAMSIPDGDTLEHAHKSYVDGVMMISRNIESALGNNGVTEVESLNAPFNPVFHEAVAFDTSDSVECDTVTKVFQKGFAIDQMVIRTAKVMVTKPEKKGPENGCGSDSASEANSQ
jgi:molecular chaperone GrpE